MRPGFADSDQLFIDPVECIDCGACVPVCPVSAIYAGDDLPEKWAEYRDEECGTLRAVAFAEWSMKTRSRSGCAFLCGKGLTLIGTDDTDPGQTRTKREFLYSLKHLA